MIEREKIVYERYEAKGYDVIKAGAPDLILLKDGKISFVEVKSKIDILSSHQKRAFKLLKKHGFSANVETVSLPKRKRNVSSPSIFDGMNEDEKTLFAEYIDLPYSELTKYSSFTNYKEIHSLKEVL